MHNFRSSSPPLPSRFPTTPSSSLAPTDADSATRSTDTDAIHARLSAHRLKYIDDPFTPLLVTRPGSVPNRPGIINVGTWLRVKGVDALVWRWIRLAAEDEGRVQILSLGAGSDTRFWRLCQSPLKGKIARYVEADFPEITSSKSRSIWKHAQLKQALGECKLSGGGTGVQSEVYHLVPLDLRDPPDSALAKLIAPQADGTRILDPVLATLILAECVLPYVDVENGNRVLRWAAETFAGSGKGGVGVVLYEMFGLDDAFGGVMRENLAARGVHIPGTIGSLDGLRERFTSTGYERADALTLRDIRTHHVPPEETERVSKLELIDEYEELDLVLGHYAVAWASKGLAMADDWVLDWRSSSQTEEGA